MIEKALEKFKKFFEESQEDKLCPHGVPEEIKITCGECQGIEQPWIAEKLSSEERDRLIERINKIKELFRPESVQKAVRDFLKYTDVQKDARGAILAQYEDFLSESNKIFGNLGATITGLNDFWDQILSDEYLIDEEPHQDRVSRYTVASLYELEAIEEELKVGQPHVDKYLEWKKRVEEFYKENPEVKKKWRGK